MGLHVEREGSGPRIVLVHGFTQTGRCWGDEAQDLAGDHEILRVDAPGHGRSGDVRADLLEGARLLGDAGGRAVYVGYSMGARLCLHLAVAAPELVQGLVMIGGTPGIEDDTERAARRDQDRQTAKRLRTEGLDAFLTGWLDQPLFAHLPAKGRFVEERRANTVEGLASSLELAGTGSQAPLWDRLASLPMPVLVIAGALDAKFAAIAERMAAVIGPPATLALLPETGHAAHLEKPAELLAVLRPWLARLPRQGTPSR